MDKHPFDGSAGGTLRAHPGLSLGETHLWICVLTDSGATRRPRVPFPKSTAKFKPVHRADQALLPRCKVALLGAVSCICCAPPAQKTKNIVS